MKERQILITITDEYWDDDDQEWFIEQLGNQCNALLYKGDYTIQEFEK